MGPKDIVDALKYTRELPYIKNKYLGLIDANQTLEDKKKSSRAELFALKNEISESKNSLRYYKSSLKDKKNKIAAMDKKIVQLNGLIDRIQNNNEEPQKIEQKVNFDR
jgi:chromosome segregation ATPase